MFRNWLYPASKDLPRGGTPHGWAAYTVLPNFNFYVNPDTTNVEYFMESLGRWIGSGGEKFLGGEGLESLLQEAFCEHRWELKFSESKQKDIYQPVKGANHPLMSDNQFKKNVGATLRGAVSDKLTALDSTSQHKVLFSNGLLVDFEPEVPVVRRGDPADRISRCSPWEFKEWADDMVSRGTSRSDAEALQAKVQAFCSKLTEKLKGDREYDVRDLEKEFLDLVRGPNDTDADNPKCPGAFLLFYGISEEVDLAVYVMRLVATCISGLTDGLMQYHVWYGPLGGNLKGTLRKLLDDLLGTFDGSTDRGYSVVMPPEVITTFGKSEGPSEVESNLSGSKAVFCDDFVTENGLLLNSALLRRFSGGNKLSAARKRKGNTNFEPTFSMHLLTNVIPEFKPRLIGADLRRLTIVPFRISYRDAAMYDEANPNHKKKKASVKRDIAKFFPEILFWARCLRPTLLIGDDSIMSHAPFSIKEHSNELKKLVISAEDEDYAEKFYKTLLSCTPSDMPTPATEVRVKLGAAHPTRSKEDLVVCLEHFVHETTAKRRGADGKVKWIRCYEANGKYLRLP